ncbi:MAG: DUF1615 domain-containing protein [Rhodoferax sp.]|nr:DUF1615 domain-containing protein [Rhodoferax sp.]
MRSALLVAGSVLALLAGCVALDAPKKTVLPPDLRQGEGILWTDLDSATRQARIARLLPATVKDRSGWAIDLQITYDAIGIPAAPTTFCASIAVIEQESGFQVNPVIPGLPGIVRRELERRLGSYNIPLFLLDAALLKKSPNGSSYGERIAALKTEQQVSTLFDEMIAELPFGEALLADKNPVHTAGPMQVSVAFAEKYSAEKPYPYASNKRMRDELFTRRGGLYFGVAILLDYPAPYDDVLYRFADFNAGRFSSRNAAFQSALAKLTGEAIARDGDLLRYASGKPSDAVSAVESALLGISHRLDMRRSDIRRDLLLEKSAEFGSSPLYKKLFQLANANANSNASTGSPLPHQAMPTIDLKSPKITRKLTTDWFAHRVKDRYRQCLARDG